jgi:hypothetical protein
MSCSSELLYRERCNESDILVTAQFWFLLFRRLKFGIEDLHFAFGLCWKCLSVMFISIQLLSAVSWLTVIAPGIVVTVLTRTLSMFRWTAKVSCVVSDLFLISTSACWVWSRDPLCRPRNTLYPQKLALTSLASIGCSVGIVRSQTKATEFVCCLLSSQLITTFDHFRLPYISLSLTSSLQTSNFFINIKTCFFILLLSGEVSTNFCG